MTEETGDKGFKVNDKRAFDDNGVERKDEAPAAQHQTQRSTSADGPRPWGSPMPKMDFITFVLSLAHSTSCHLGVSPNPETKVCEENLPLARETIDIIGMLQEKTQGNLTGEEERILHEILYDLRLAYIQAAKK